MAKNAVPERARVSLKRDNFVAGGVLPEGDYLFKEANFVVFAYTKKDGTPTGATTVAKRILLVPMTKDAKGNFVPEAGGNETDQHWSIGDLKNFVPSEDGNFLEVVGKSTLSNQCKYYFLFDSLINAGVPEGLYDQEGAKLLNGVIAHIKHIPAPDYSRVRNQSAVGTGVVPQGEPEKKKFDETIPVVSAIHVAPWEKKGGKPAAAPKAQAPAPAAAPEPEEAEEVAEGENSERLAGFIANAVAGAGGKISKTKLKLECHKQFNAAKIDAGVRDAELKVFENQSALEDILASVDCAMDGLNIVKVE